MRVSSHECNNRLSTNNGFTSHSSILPQRPNTQNIVYKTPPLESPSKNTLEFRA